jgi:hypothetical protein
MDRRKGHVRSAHNHISRPTRSSQIHRPQLSCLSWYLHRSGARCLSGQNRSHQRRPVGCCQEQEPAVSHCSSLYLYCLSVIGNNYTGSVDGDNGIEHENYLNSNMRWRSRNRRMHLAFKYDKSSGLLNLVCPEYVKPVPIFTEPPSSKRQGTQPSSYLAFESLQKSYFDYQDHVCSTRQNGKELLQGSAFALGRRAKPRKLTRSRFPCLCGRPEIHQTQEYWQDVPWFWSRT